VKQLTPKFLPPPPLGKSTVSWLGQLKYNRTLEIFFLTLADTKALAEKLKFFVQKLPAIKI